ncbi:unnamed protein product [Miscanthus lutarioriparius]|uniref:Uncharacterized protein n=1 Tax=Miscanthus lutarioriparius TaxID=422564 RepID=A0A811PDJ9_9POAL|nr:unnamed protein product [Miscanthus lutarioriparius]
MAHLARLRPVHHRISIVAGMQCTLHLARQSIRVTKYGPGEFVAEFGEPQERDRALCKGCIETEGSIFPIRPWLSAGGGLERTWWYQVKVTMEHVPLEAWNEEGVKLILGDSCIFDRDSDGDRTTLYQEDDPMAHEHACTRLSRAPQCYSLDDNADNRAGSPESRPVSKLQAPRPEEVVFGPGVQLDAPQLSNFGPSTEDVSDVDDPAIRDATDRHNYDEETAEGPNDYDAFCARIFKPAPAPILLRPDLPPPPPPTSSRGRRRAPAASTRSSTRLAARPSSVPIAERAQHKLMRELSFINDKSTAPDAAVTTYIDMYGDGLPEEAVKAIRVATRMGNKELSRELAAIAAESGAAEMEAP